MSLVPAAYGPCKKCFVAVKGEDVIYHHGTWKCVRPEVTEEEFQRLWIEREERMQRFREKYPTPTAEESHGHGV